MRHHRFMELLDTLLAEGRRHPDISSVEKVNLGRQGEVLRIKCVDGFEVDLRVVNTAPPSGDNHANPEVIVTKHELAKR